MEHSKTAEAMKVGRAMIDLAISYDLMSQRLEKDLRPLQLNMTQLSLLFHFSWRPEQAQTVSRLVQVMGINQPGVTKATTAMVGKGWLRKESDADDARIKHLYITNEGLEILEKAKRTTLPTLMSAFSVFSPAQLDTFSKGLHTLKCHLDETR